MEATEDKIEWIWQTTNPSKDYILPIPEEVTDYQSQLMLKTANLSGGNELPTHPSRGYRLPGRLEVPDYPAEWRFQTTKPIGS
jgi:hypothetical protein